MSIIDRIEQLGTNMYNLGVSAKRGILIFIDERGSRALHDVYSLTGFEKMSKVAIAHLRFLSLFDSMKGIFDDCLKTFEAQKDLYYATRIFNSGISFIRKDPATGQYVFQIPELRLTLYAIGDLLDVGKFFQKYKVLSFPLCTRLATEFGALKIFNTRLEDIPVVSSLFNKPKDFFVFVASYYECKRCICTVGTCDWENILTFMSASGRMALIFFGKTHGRIKWFAVVDMITQDAGLISLFVKCHKAREARFN